MKLPAEFFLNEDVEQVARELLGTVLVTQINGQRCSGIIVETEAYAGVNDKASHAWNGRRTKRTGTMYLPGGHAYVYLIYGIHSLFNVVTNKPGIPHAVLVRAIEPLEGIGAMLTRRKMREIKYNLCAGPGLLTQALGIRTAHSGIDLQGNTIWIEAGKQKTEAAQILSRPRVGVGYAAEDALLPRRYSIKANPWVSPARTGNNKQAAP